MRRVIPSHFFEEMIMLNIKSILQSVLNDLHTKSDNVKIVDDQHVIDKLAGVEYHLYDDCFKITRGNEQPVTPSHLSPDEQAVIVRIKEAIADPTIYADKKANYKKYTDESRKRLSSWYESPIPLATGVEEEKGTENYIRQ